MSKAYFVSAKIYKEKPDNLTKLLGWKVSIREMRNDALNTLVYQLIEKNITKEEKGMVLTFLGVMLLEKIYWE